MKKKTLSTTKKLLLFLVMNVLILAIQGCMPAADAKEGEVAATVVPVVSSVPKVGALAPSIELTDLDGNVVNLADYHGKIVLLNFWATWCPPCQSEIPGFVDVYEDLNEDGLEIVAVSVGEKESVVVSFAEEKGMNFSVLLDQDGTIAKKYLVRSIPTNVFVDREGVVRRIVVGAIPEHTLREYIAELL